MIIETILQETVMQVILAHHGGRKLQQYDA